jgi:hypothetical protein
MKISRNRDVLLHGQLEVLLYRQLECKTGAPDGNISQRDPKKISAQALWGGPVARKAQRSFVAPQHQDLY